MLQPKGKPRGRGLGRIPVGGWLVAHGYSRVVTEAWPRATAQISQCTSDPSEGTGPPEERPPTKAAPPHEKAMAYRYYQLLSGHAAIGPYLRDEIGKTNNDKC